MWCPSCGDEFREGFTRCEDCRVALVPDPPGRRRRRLPPWSGEQRVEFDLSGWPDAQRAALDTWIFADNIPAEWEADGRLVVARNRAHEIDDLIALLDADAEAAAADEPTPEPAPEHDAELPPTSDPT